MNICYNLIVFVLSFWSLLSDQPRILSKVKYTTETDLCIPIVQAQFQAGPKLRLGLDTGSDYDLLSEERVKEMGLNPFPLNDPFGSPIKGFWDEEIQVARAIWWIGKFVPNDAFVIVNHKFQEAAFFGKVEGIIGGPILPLVSPLFDPGKHEITLFNGGNVTPEELKSVKMDDAFVVPKIEEPKVCFWVSVRINDQEKTDLVIDTGGATTYLPFSVVQKLGLKPIGQERNSETFFGKLSRKTAIVRSLKLGNLELKDVPIEYSEQEQAKFPPHIGMDILEKYRFLIDKPAGKLYLKPLKAEKK